MCGTDQCLCAWPMHDLHFHIKWMYTGHGQDEMRIYLRRLLLMRKHLFGMKNMRFGRANTLKYILAVPNFC